jgi:FKBP-type peptidyl-prolyl cis-trans isomerase FklB
MRWILTLVMVAMPVIASAQDAPALKTDKDRLSYAMGMDLGTQLKSAGVDLDAAVFADGLKAGLAGTKTALTPAEAKALITELQKSLATRQAAAAKAVGDKNSVEGEAFLTANKAKDGVVALPSGLQYRIITAGTGKKPQATDTVVCQYRGTLLIGTEFDSSYKSNEPATFRVGQVIRGWVEVLQLMPVGSK